MNMPSPYLCTFPTCQLNLLSVISHQLTIISMLSEFKSLLFSAASSCQFKSALTGPIWEPSPHPYSVSVQFSVQEEVSAVLTSYPNLHQHQYLVSAGVSSYSGYSDNLMMVPYHQRLFLCFLSNSYCSTVNQ